MATQEDLDSESESDKDDADEGAKIVVGLVATVTSEAEPKSNSEEENEVYSKIPIEELIESLKELLTHFEQRTNELKDLKEKYVDSMKQQESTLLDLKASEKELKGLTSFAKPMKRSSSSYVRSYKKSVMEKQHLQKQWQTYWIFRSTT